MIIPDRAAPVNPFSQTFSKTLRISMIIAKGGGRTLSLYPQQRADLPPIQRLAAGGEKRPISGREEWPPSAAGECWVPGWDKRGQGHRMVPLPPLDSPKPSFALTHRRCAAKRGLRGLGSVRRADFGTLSGPEFPLRKPPRITVRGHPVQGVRPVAAKSSASIKGYTLEHQTPLWAPRF